MSQASFNYVDIRFDRNITVFLNRLIFMVYSMSLMVFFDGFERKQYMAAFDVQYCSMIAL